MSFVSEPPPKSIWFERNNNSALVNMSIVKAEVNRMHLAGLVSQVGENECAALSPLSMVSSSKGKFRLVLDLSELNKYVLPPKFKLEDVRSMWSDLKEASFGASFDFRAGYHHVAVAEASRKWLGFKLEGRCYVFNVMPFGWSLAPFLFTKIFKPLVKSWRKAGLSVCLYLDDGLVLAPSYQKCTEAVARVRGDLERAGVTIAEEKSSWIPSETVSWLGFELELRNSACRVSASRIETTLRKVEALRSSRKPRVKDRQAVLGCLSSMHLVLEGKETLFCGPWLDVVSKQTKFCPKANPEVSLTPEEERCANFWLQNLEKYAQRKFFEPELDAVVESDASATGVGAVLKDRNGEYKQHLAIRHQDGWDRQSSTQRELVAVLHTVHAFRDFLADKVVLFKLDNQASVRILIKGSMMPHLRSIAVETHEVLASCNCRPKFMWIPRSLNAEADELSRTLDRDDWAIQPAIFRAVTRRFGPVQFDAFADKTNAKTTQFAALSNDGTSFVDFFSLCTMRASCLQQHVWCVPPAALIPRILFEAKRLEMVLILGMPKWESHFAFPHIVDSSGRYKNFIRGVWEFPTGTNICIPGPISSQAGAFSSSFLHFPFLFLSISFRPEVNRV